ncbi:AAA family ATPase [Staphylococcus simulans]|uniref:AAA family ATPase n=1 Tax=Staphylococcus simulans TaxID=1286 RepID=UPI0021CEE4DC|nr:AAA family ATPase [Staphylococcus simulans]UXR50198.1 AAA family ATPase [Staphylococcus simulans]
MKLISLEMNNFRQYYGKQIIKFATEKERNTTIIFGENGGGKTGIYRALMFVLFGSKTISQDGIGGNKVHLTNLKALDEGLYEPASVTLKFEHEDRLYEIKRTLNSSKIGSLLHETIDSQQLIEIDLETGNTLPNIVTEEDEVKDFINKIINEEIKDFFLFDAEKIDTLAKTDTEVRREVKNAIFSLLQIDKLDKAREIVNDLSKMMSHKLVMSSKSGTVKQIDEQLNETVEKLQEQNEKKDLLEKEIDNLNDIIEENQIILKKNQEISLKKEQMKTKESNVNNLKYQLKTTKSNISNALFQESPSLLVNSTLKKNQRFLNEFLGENKINIPSDLIEKSLNDECCVLCSNDLSDHGKIHLKRLLDYEKDAESYELARMLLHYCEGKIENFERDNVNLKNNMKNYNNILNEMEDEEQEIKRISKEIAEQARNDVSLIDVQRMIDADNNKRDDFIGQLHLVNTDLNDITIKKEELERELERLFEIEKESKHEQRQVSLLKALTTELKGIKKEFS